MQLALTDPEFRERAEALATFLEDSEYREAFATTLGADALRKTAGAQLIAQETVMAAGDKRKQGQDLVGEPSAKRAIYAQGATADIPKP